MKTHVMFLLVCYLNNVSLALLRSLDNYRELRKKINKIFTGKEGEEMFLNIDEYGYPRTNETLRQLYKQQWLDYYQCLREIYEDLRQERITHPSALVALEGTSVTLKCQICVSPIEMHVANLIEWYFNSSGKGDIITTTVQNTDHILNSPDNRYIIIYSVKLEQAGVYWCEMGDTTGSAYYLHIDNDFEAMNVYSDTTPFALQVGSPTNVPGYELKVYTTWTMWSPCSTCDAIGIKLRYGYCTVSLLETLADKYIANESASIIDKLRYTKREEAEKYEWNQEHNGIKGTTYAMMINSSLKTRLRTALLLFKNKLPCKSRFVPKQVQLIPIIKNRKSKITRRYCKKKCRKDVIFQVRDEKGNVLESANNSAGIYSTIQGIPEPLPLVTHSVVYGKHNKKIKLVCPGNLNADVPIVWRIGDKVINPFRIKIQSNGKIRIDSQMHILFASLKFEDANTYSCWQNDEVAGIIKLNVIREMEFKLNHHIILVGAILIIGILLIMFWRAFKGRTRYTMH